MNKSAIVTGGTRGIGKAITEMLVKKGYKVFITYCRNHDLARKLENQYPGQVYAFKVDSGSPCEISKFFADLREEPIEILVNNAGINRDGLFLTSQMSDVDNVFSTNLLGPIYFCKEVIPIMMKKRKGSILNISSKAANFPKLGNSIYGASKSALERLTQTLALEIERFGITVNNLAPSFVDTDMVKQFITSAESQGGKSNRKKMKIRSPQEIADTAWIILSRQIDINGKTIQL